MITIHTFCNRTLRVAALLSSFLVAQLFLLASAHGQERENLEVRIENESQYSVECAVYDAGTGDPLGSKTIEPAGGDDLCDIDFSGEGGDFSVDSNLLVRIEIGQTAMRLVTHRYLFYYCQWNELEENNFFCPNEEDQGNGPSDIVIFYESGGGVRVEPSGLLNGGAPDDIDDNFSDHNWIAPYNLDTYCNGVPTCDYSGVEWFLTPQTDPDEFTFTAKDLTQPIERTWDFNGVTANFTSGQKLTLNDRLNIDESTVNFSGSGSQIVLNDDASILFKGNSGSFNIQAGMSFKLGDDARITLERAVTFTGTSNSRITFEPTSGEKQWDYLDLKADGNDFDYVVFDGGYKTVEVRSENNTFDYVMFKNGYRGISSYYSASSGRSSFTLDSCMVKNNSTVGVVALHTDFTLDKTIVKGSGHGGVWISDATSSGFTENEITDNAQSVATRSGVELIYNGILDTGNDADNDIINNPYRDLRRK